MENVKYQQCEKCVLDIQDDPIITFDKQNICNHCRGYEAKMSQIPETQEKRDAYNFRQMEAIKQWGKGRKYDCLIGLSGGVDSSYLALKVKEFGLRPLIVHFDNGWNSELAVNNIENIIKNLGFDLYTYVVNWEEFKDLQLAYIKSGVLDWEVPTDHGFYAMLHDQAYKHKIKYILSGHNIVTEGVLPKSMRWSKLDVANILDIHKKFGKIRLKTFPLLNFYKLNYYRFLLNIKFYSPLNYMEYDKNKAKKEIIEKLEWRDYGGKHCESIFTKFYQNYVLPEKFDCDKRKAHLSALINSGQMTKEEAIDELSKPAYDPEELKEDMEYIIKKLGISVDEFEAIMKSPPVSHLEFSSYETGLYRKHERFMQSIKPITKTIKGVMDW